ncbi:MAG: putative N-acetylmannosamine-6-phosphate 2-epimerase [Chloroflexi bacterium]|nr:putative N-acetylmannosamine-6-phosphate 2-epimerase [Chloroflexota bacterium]
MAIMDSLKQLCHGLIVSCQAQTSSPLRDSNMMAAMALAAEQAGAAGIRADGPDDIAAIRAVVKIPIIGIYKQELPGTDVYITPTLESARAVVTAGADLVALDATARPHPGNLTTTELIRSCQTELGVPVMADISILPEGIAAAEAGADLVATTLVGYTPYSRHLSPPDFELIRELVLAVATLVVVEGHISTPAEAHRALDLGAYAAVVGAAITQPDQITRRFVDSTRASRMVQENTDMSERRCSKEKKIDPQS